MGAGSAICFFFFELKLFFFLCICRCWAGSLLLEVQVSPFLRELLSFPGPFFWWGFLGLGLHLGRFVGFEVTLLCAPVALAW